MTVCQYANSTKSWIPWKLPINANSTVVSSVFGMRHAGGLTTHQNINCCQSIEWNSLVGEKRRNSFANEMSLFILHGVTRHPTHDYNNPQHSDKFLCFSNETTPRDIVATDEYTHGHAHETKWNETKRNRFSGSVTLDFLLHTPLPILCSVCVCGRKQYHWHQEFPSVALGFVIK